MRIRKAQISDLDQLSALFDGYRIFYRQNSNLTAARNFLMNRLKNQDSIIFVCEDEHGNLSGFTQMYPLFSSTLMAKKWLLNDLYVHPDYRGKGIALQLLEQAKQLVRDTGACGFFLETEVTNEIGNKLYPRAGMKLNTETNYYDWLVE